MQTQVLKTEQERKEFLENDFVDRLVRIEQRVSAKYGKLIKYTETYCYKNLAPENKKRYDSYLKSKKKKRFAFAASLAIPLLGVLSLSNGITTNVVKEGVGESSYQLLTIVSISFLAGLLVGAAIFTLVKIRRERRFGPLFKPLENLAKPTKKKSL